MRRALALSSLVLFVGLVWLPRPGDVARAGIPCLCGDGVLCGLEECDDGNTLDDDGCTAPDCQFDCGDGEIDSTATPPETCDDGNATNGDVCDDDPAASSPGNCTPAACGNGVVAGTEECDDGNTLDCDPCPSHCGTLVLIPTPPAAQRCVNAVNRSLARLAKARNADSARCVRAASAGAALGDCLEADRSGKVERASARTARVFSSRDCTGVESPDFAFTDAATVTGAAVDEMLASLGRLLGTPAVVAERRLDPIGARCQREALRQHDRLVARWLLEANRAKRSLLKGGPTRPPAVLPCELAAGIEAAIETSAPLASAQALVEAHLERSCGSAPFAALFACGAPGSAAELAACVADSARHAACRAFETADALDLDCPDPP
jgi:cysteine-rich repeat protein